MKFKFQKTPTCAIFAIIYTALGFFGYGNDNDSYAMINSGLTFIESASYFPSRFQGNFIVEVCLGLFSFMGGHYLCNFFSALLASVFLYILWGFVEMKLSKSKTILVIGLVACHPYFIIAATSSMDYIYSLSFIAIGSGLLFRNNWGWAAGFMALALSARLGNAVVVASIYVFAYGLEYKQNEKILNPVFWSAIMGVIGLGLLYLPTLIYYDFDFKFLNVAMGEWSFSEHLLRFVYKNVRLWSMPVGILLIIILWLNRQKIRLRSISGLSVFLAFVFLSTQYLFFKVPIDISYLFPVLLVSVYVIVQLSSSKILLKGMLVCMVLYNFIHIDFVKFEYNENGSEAIGAQKGIFITKGVLVDDLCRRPNSQNKYLKDLNLKNPQFKIK